VTRVHCETQTAETVCELNQFKVLNDEAPRRFSCLYYMPEIVHLFLGFK